MATIMEALGGHNGETIVEVLGGNKGETIAEVVTESGLEPVEKLVVSYNANGGEGTIPSVSVFPGKSINVSDGTGLTAPEGKVFAGWAKTDSAQSATVVSPFIPEEDTVLYAVWADAEPDPAPLPEE